MTPSLLALLAYVGWALLFELGLLLYRTWLVLVRKRRANAFATDGSDVSPFMNRLCRAMYNTLDNMPVFAAIVLAAHFSGHGEVTDPLARWVVGARVAQSLVHLRSTSQIAVMARATFYAVQVVIELIWVLQLLRIGFMSV
jgi:uncharacterized MAPEG superfamily protein